MPDKDIVAELQALIDGEDTLLVSDVLGRAIAEILRLRSLTGAVSAGNGDFRTVKALLPHAGTSFADKPNTGC